MDINYSIIGSRIKKIRKNKKITQENLAEIIDVSVSYISRVERGTTKINLKRLLEICAVLEISAGEILDGISSNSTSYLHSDLNDLLKNCPAEKMDLIYNLTKVVIYNKI